MANYTGGRNSSFPMVWHWMISRKGGGTGPATDDVMETLVEKSEISTSIQPRWEHDLCGWGTVCR